MSRIVVTFESEDANDLVHSMREFLAGVTVTQSSMPEVKTFGIVVPQGGLTQNAETSVPPTFADRKLGVAPESSQPEEAQAPEAPAPEEKPRRTRKAKTAAEPAAAPAEAPAPAAPAKPLDKDALREVGGMYMAAFGVGATVDLLKKYGAAKLSDLAEEKYAEVYAEFRKALDERESA